ncbi:hypothetical protein HN777_02860 [Candidatus Woesearchaeota archaeon]|mgnify:CR=1 FL=1|jgi:hypothetical protein|nr:hypothetical protein [Candidatus Woesearchaeota archaeon]MBT7402704.1 hypothetical protein [Candidatus Woesearchaeota archaeon]
MSRGTYSRQQIRANYGSDFSKIASKQIIQQHRFLLNQMKKQQDLESKLPEEEDSQNQSEQILIPSQFQLSLRGSKYGKIKIEEISHINFESDKHNSVRGNR